MNLDSEGSAVRRWALSSAWAAVALVAFQVGATALAVGADQRGWSVSTLAQAAVVAVLAIGAFRESRPVLLLMAALGLVRFALAAMTLSRISSGAIPNTQRLTIELAITIPIALVWIAAGVAILRTGARSRAASGRGS